MSMEQIICHENFLKAYGVLDGSQDTSSSFSNSRCFISHLCT
jgi:hypothetical protein